MLPRQETFSVSFSPELAHSLLLFYLAVHFMWTQTKRKFTDAEEKVKEHVKELIEKVLNTNGYVEMRSIKMTQDDFLQLLAVFNEHGIHFVG